MMDTASPLPTAPDPAASLLSVVEKGSLLDLDAALQLKISELNESSGTEGYTPLIVAVTKRNVRMVEKLLAVGANPNIPVSGTGIYGGYTGVHIASKNGDVDILKALHKAGGDVNLEGADSWSPLHVAAFSGKRNTLLCLLDCGVQIDIPNKHALTPLLYVCDHGKVREVRDLLMRGANIHLKDINGDGMLHHALHYQMHKLFEGEYDMPECQYDVVVILAMHGANPDDTNKDEDLPTKFAVDGMRDVLRILYHHHKEFQRSKTEWNYMTLLAAQIEHFLGMGLPLRHATDLYEALKKLEHNRLQHKKEREETRKNQGGCPVIRSKKSVSPSLSHHPEVGSRSDNLTANRSPSSDPSGGQCPFFAMKKEGVEKVHASSHFIEEIDKDDHSPFNEGNERRASTVHSTKPSVPSKESSGLQTGTLKKCPLRSISNCTEDVALPHLTNVTSVCTFLYEHRTVVLLCIICYLLGTLTERKLTSLTHSGGSSSSTSKS